MFSRLTSSKTLLLLPTIRHTPVGRTVALRTLHSFTSTTTAAKTLAAAASMSELHTSVAKKAKLATGTTGVRIESDTMGQVQCEIAVIALHCSCGWKVNHEIL